MKNIIIISLLFFTKAFPQESDNKLNFTEVVAVEGVSKDELYNRAKLWFAKAFNSADAVIQMDSKEDGQLVGKALLQYKPTILSASEQTKGPVRYTVSIFVKEGRYKYEITDFYHDPYGNSYGAMSLGLITNSSSFPEEKAKNKKLKDKVWSDIKKQIESTAIPLQSSLKEAMSKSAETKKNDW